MDKNEFKTKYDEIKQLIKEGRTDEALDIIESEGVLEGTMRLICEKIGFYLNHRCYGKIKTEAMIFSNSRGYLGETAGFRNAVERIRQENE